MVEVRVPGRPGWGLRASVIGIDALDEWLVALQQEESEPQVLALEVLGGEYSGHAVVYWAGPLACQIPERPAAKGGRGRGRIHPV
jgi:hypothetical protein